MTSNLTHAIALTGPAARERANTRLVMLIGTLEYVTNHCTDTNLAGALDLLSVGAEDLQALVGASSLKRGAPLIASRVCRVWAIPVATAYRQLCLSLTYERSNTDARREGAGKGSFRAVFGDVESGMFQDERCAQPFWISVDWVPPVGPSRFSRVGAPETQCPCGCPQWTQCPH